MTEDRFEQFEQLMADAKETYRRVPAVDFEAMWTEIDGRRATGDGLNVTPLGNGYRPSPIRHRSTITQRLAIAATLVIGIALGRASMSLSKPAVNAVPQPAASVAAATAEPQPYDAETSKYLGQTAALLIALPSEVKAGRANAQFVERAGELLTRTRLLIDSPAANDPQMRSLLDDLELVLAQVVRLQNDKTDRNELNIISRALEQRDVIPRLRTAVADISAN